MPKQITAYQAEDGTLHSDACAAAKRDLELLIQRSPIAENAPYAKKVLEWLTDASSEIVTRLREYEGACPRALAALAAPTVRAEPNARENPELQGDGS